MLQVRLLEVDPAALTRDETFWAGAPHELPPPELSRAVRSRLGALRTLG